ncbi:MAG: undecaprenyl-diphosphate phosphatase [Deltaproteobacteria bacterium]|jgi:undecaprenyl-diphosphatase|nr:undecaprenyl-diphosphate phosphatase [Deltaproteobacteria bacterium]MBT4269270.1 undecaprenyl-diphosphate phosphatase [Deltaproteobacteria bacterium]MBT4639215.1 undecaprenyl-diphosphate phosphatase [Deltaproteobacteria bacterium]MBT6500127.1 undecaprenyl-diphosphate phosphatase [Deltaproteobacteria bacterium]MBT6611700.1 undecaprenyl-diphosphate phosphatase [Deltaproteobacteria bacterium]
MIIIYLKAILIAVVEGLTEFIPVSSTGHMILIGNFIKFTGEKAATFEIFIQAGAILAVVIIYRNTFSGLIPTKMTPRHFFKSLFMGKSYPTGLHILLSITPIMIAGFLLYSIIKTHLFSPITVSFGLIIGGILMIVVEYLPIKQTITRLEDISYRQSFLIGLGQCLAIWPGMSRSGSTMITGLLLGIKHKPIADFSFIIAVPVMFAAVIFDVFKSLELLEIGDLGYFGIGFFVAFFVAWASIKWFLNILTKVRLIPFGIYRTILGCISLWIYLG